MGAGSKGPLLMPLDPSMSPVAVTLLGFICVVLCLALSFAGFGLERVKAR